MNPFSGDKLLRFPERIAEWMRTGKTSGPIVIDMDLTNRCPHNCPACPGEWRHDPTAEMSKSMAERILAQFRDIGTLAVSFGGGGDPLAHPHAIEIFEMARDMGYSVGVITNGAVMRPGYADRLATCVSWVRVSLDAATAKMHSRVHGVPEAHFARVCGNIIKLASAKKDSCVVGIGFLTSEQATYEIIDAAKLARTLGVDYIQYRPFNHDDYNPRSEIEIASQLYDTDTFKVMASWPKYDLIPYVKDYNRCLWPSFGAVVTAHGHLHLCCDMRCSAGMVADLNKENVADVWNSGRMQMLAEGVDLGKCPALCRGNNYNITLNRIANPITHEEFL